MESSLVTNWKASQAGIACGNPRKGTYNDIALRDNIVVTGFHGDVSHVAGSEKLPLVHAGLCIVADCLCIVVKFTATRGKLTIPWVSILNLKKLF